MATNDDVPAELKPLLALAAEWAWPTERQRQEKRATSSMQQLEAYYGRLKPHVLAIGVYLDNLSTTRLSADQQAMFRLALMYMETALSVEAYRAPEAPLALPRHKFLSPTELVSSI